MITPSLPRRKRRGSFVLSCKIFSDQAKFPLDKGDGVCYPNCINTTNTVDTSNTSQTDRKDRQKGRTEKEERIMFGMRVFMAAATLIMFCAVATVMRAR